MLLLCFSAAYSRFQIFSKISRKQLTVDTKEVLTHYSPSTVLFLQDWFKNTSSDALGPIISDVSWCFSSFSIMHTRSGDPARDDQTLACVPAALAHRSLFLIQSHLETLSAAFMVDLMAFLPVALLSLNIYCIFFILSFFFLSFYLCKATLCNLTDLK